MEAEVEENVPPSDIGEILPEDLVSERGAERRLILTVTCRCEALDED